MSIDELIKRLHEAAKEIAAEGHNGWGNSCIDAADTIERLRDQNESLRAAASYLSAEVKDAWEQGRISVDTFHAALSMDKALDD